MKKLFKVLFAFLFVLFGLNSCSAQSNNDKYYEEGGELAGGDDVANNVVVDTGRKVIYSATYTITSEEIVSIKNDINQKTIDINGYISSSNEYTTYATVVYNVPTDQFNLFLDYVDSFEGIGSKSISSKDITSSYSQIEARISVLQASRAAYVSILESGNLSRTEIMQIQDKIDSIDTELLKISLEKDTYDNQLAYSTVTINYYTAQVAPKEKTFFENYGDYLSTFFTTIGKILLYIFPFALISAVIFSSIFFPIYLKNKKRNKK